LTTVLLCALTVSIALCCFALPLSTQQPAHPEKADSVLIFKKAHVLELLAEGRVIRTYRVALGRGGLAPKQREGDGRTPEGHYVIITVRYKSPIPTPRTGNARPGSAFHPAEPSRFTDC
jgi:murein L,D-transpeptidase YafK